MTVAKKTRLIMAHRRLEAVAATVFSSERRALEFVAKIAVPLMRVAREWFLDLGLPLHEISGRISNPQAKRQGRRDSSCIPGGIRTSTPSANWVHFSVSAVPSIRIAEPLAGLTVRRSSLSPGHFNAKAYIVRSSLDRVNRRSAPSDHSSPSRARVE